MTGPSVDSEAVFEVTCPHCRRQTDRIQAYHPPVLVMLFYAFAWTNDRIAGCPECVRTRLWKLFRRSILTANIAFPIVAPFILWDVRSSHRHDKPGIPPEYAGWAYLPPPEPEVEQPHTSGKGVGKLIALLVVVAVVGFLFFVLPKLVG